MQLEKGRINSRQFIILAACYTIGDSVLIMPSMIARHAEQDAWISAVLGILIGFGFLLVYGMLLSRFPALTIAEMAEAALGSTLGRIAVLIALVPYWFLLAASILREIGDFMTTQIIPETPVQAIYIIVLIVMLHGLRLGLEPLARTSEIFFPWIVGLFLLLAVFVSAEIDFRRLEPFAMHHFGALFLGSYPLLANPFMEIVTLLMIAPYVAVNKGSVNRPLFLGVAIGSAFLFLITLITTSVLGADITFRSTYPSYVMAKKINIGDFLERLEIIIAILWLLTIYFKVVLNGYALTIASAQALRLKEVRSLLLPVSLLLLVTAQMIAPNIVSFYNFISKYWPLYTMTVALAFPCLLLVISKLRKQKGKQAKRVS